MLLNRAVNPSPIKSIQRGEVVAGNSGNTVTIAAVNLSKSIIVISEKNSLVSASNYSQLLGNKAVGKLVTGTSAYFESGGGGSNVCWQVIEYV